MVKSKSSKARASKQQSERLNSPNTPAPVTAAKSANERTFARFNWQLFLPILGVTALPVVLSGKLWQEVWQGVRPYAWDGTGHYAIAQIYSRSIFPDTFGWTDAYFGGMPFPNFYPPLFYWCVALLTHTYVLSFAAAFKLLVALPVLLLPAAMWLLGRGASGGSRLAATGASLASLPLLVDQRFLLGSPSGLDYFSTFQIGLYTQPLGFVLLTLWLVSYLSAPRKYWKVALSCALLALTVLSNFFNAATSGVFVAAVVAGGLVRYKRATDDSRRREERRALLTHLLIPPVAACLALFWLVPMLAQYEYFVTRPYVIEADKLVTPALWGWYALAAAGGVIWLRRPTPAAWSYLAACAALAAGVLFAETLALGWFPLQSSRFLATLNFLLAVPAGLALAAAFRRLAALLGESSKRGQTLSLGRARYTTGVACLLLLLYLVTSPGPRWAYAFYPEGGKQDADSVLDFAREHRDGRYLVESINPGRTGISFDARAINSYLGAQGNETLSGVFHEASPDTLFTLPQANAFSDYPDSFGVSSLLADDLDFAAQPMSRHVERARLLGVKYLLLRSPVMKARMAQESSVAARHDFDNWGVFELSGEPAPLARMLPYRPALVVSSFTLKQRRANEWNFVRLAEEQFADGWFDVLLVRSPERKIDHLSDLDQFGALILDTYEYDDEGRAYSLLKEFSQKRLLILLSSESELFRRIKSSPNDFPFLQIVERGKTEPGELLEAIKPAHHYQDSPVRMAWVAIRRALDEHKVVAGEAGAPITSEVGQNSISLDAGAREAPVPILISTTFHPRWHREDGGRVYAATPFYILTFVQRRIRLVYGREWFERAALCVSAGTLLLLILFCIRKRQDSFARREGKLGTPA